MSALQAMAIVISALISTILVGVVAPLSRAFAALGGIGLRMATLRTASRA